MKAQARLISTKVSLDTETIKPISDSIISKVKGGTFEISIDDKNFSFKFVDENSQDLFCAEPNNVITGIKDNIIYDEIKEVPFYILL
ncbi:MAG: hypothetical protein O2911_09365 [Bacteroidetes bacterium]|nr:hypothetical protein [Bacteroidota bacterium]